MSKLRMSHRTRATMQPRFYYWFQGGHPILMVSGEERRVSGERAAPEKSILSLRKDPDQYPEITYLGEQYDRIRIYREWSFGRYTPPRQPQKADQRNDFLEEDCSNLGLMLNRLRRDIRQSPNCWRCWRSSIRRSRTSM